MIERDGRPWVLLISGSPSARSKTSAVLDAVARRVTEAGVLADIVSVRDFPPEALLLGYATDPAVVAFLGKVERAAAIVIATPIYKASYTGALKTVLDVIPPGALAGKIVMPLATAGTLAHFLALDFALRPVLGFLGVRHTLPNVFLLETSFRDAAAGTLDDAGEERLSTGIAELLTALNVRPAALRRPEVAGTPAA